MSAIKAGKVALENDVAAQFAGARPEIDDVVRGPHHIRIVFDHDDRVAEIAQFGENANQARRIAAMQTDGGLVENVTCAHQTRTEASSELDALRFASRQRGRKTVQRQILQAHVVQEFEPLLDLDENLAGDARFFGSQLQMREKFRASAIFMRTASAMVLSPTRA